MNKSTKQKPAISLIMPIYNSESHLEEAVTSALGQTLTNIELICIDDGSTDSSPQILSRLKEADKRIQVITQANLGAGPARNAGLRAARGSYVGFLDSDDLYPSDTCLKELYDLAVEHKAKIAGGSLFFLKEGQTSKAVTKEADFTFHETKMINYKDFQQAYYYQRFIYSLDMLKKARIAFPEYRRFQDVVFFVNAMIEANVFLSTEIPSYIYRVSNNYITLNDRQITDMLKGYKYVLTVAKNKEFSSLFSFLSVRISGKNKINEMVEESIKRGNKEAAALYPAVLSICNSPFEEKIDADANDLLKDVPANIYINTEVGNNETGLRAKLRSLFSKAEK